MNTMLHLFVPGGCKSRIVGCGPDCWSISHTTCSHGQCSCVPGYLPHYSGDKLSLCVSSVNNSSLQSDQASGSSPASDINIHYYPGDYHQIITAEQVYVILFVCQRLVFSTTGCLQCSQSPASSSFLLESASTFCGKCIFSPVHHPSHRSVL